MDQVSALNVGFMERLQYFNEHIKVENYYSYRASRGFLKIKATILKTEYREALGSRRPLNNYNK